MFGLSPCACISRWGYFCSDGLLFDLLELCTLCSLTLGCAVLGFGFQHMKQYYDKYYADLEVFLKDHVKLVFQ